MNGLSVRARGLMKRFRVLRRQRTVLRALRALRDPSVLRKDLLALDDVSFDVAAGEKVALVGRTGSGKSTLARLLLGLYLPAQGQILYDGKPLQSLDYRAVRSQFGIVLQESFMFSGTIRGSTFVSVLPSTVAYSWMPTVP